jgi:HlyD family secretion protein
MIPLGAGRPKNKNASDAASHNVVSVQIPRSIQRILWGLILVAVSSQAACSWPPESALSASRDADVGRKDAPERISALGRVEPRGGLISIAGLPGARIGRMSVREGDCVSANAELFVLDNYEELDANCKMIAAQRDEAKTLLNLETKSEALLRAELDVEEAQLQQLDPYDRRAHTRKVDALKDAGENARIDYDRLIRLKEASSSLVSQQQIDAQKLKVSSVQAELDAAEALLQKYDQSQKIARRKLEIQRQKAAIAAEKGKLAARITSLEASYKAAVIQRDRAVVRAAAAGQILRILCRAGETIGTQPVLQMGDTREMDVVAEVSDLQERDLDRADGPVRITAPDMTLEGTIDREKRGLMVGRNTLYSLDPTVDADRRVILVRIHLDHPSSRMVDRLTNLQVDVEIHLGSRPAEPMRQTPADVSTVNVSKPQS